MALTKLNTDVIPSFLGEGNPVFIGCPEVFRDITPCRLVKLPTVQRDLAASAFRTLDPLHPGNGDGRIQRNLSSN